MHKDSKLVISKETVSNRAMDEAALPDALNIERNTQAVPWTQSAFEESLNGDNHCTVLLVNNAIVAFSVLSTVSDELHILNLAVHPDAQGYGLGHKLMQDIIDYAVTQQSKKLFLEVRKSNETAQSLYQKWQFKKIAVRKNYYRTPESIHSGEQADKEDAIIMLRQLDYLKY